MTSNGLPPQLLLDGATYEPILPVQEDGVTILGSDTASSWTTTLGPYSAAAAPTAKRLGRAQKLAASLLQLARATSRAGTLQAAWTLHRLVLASALSFDVRAQPLNVVQSYADALTALVRSVCEAIVPQAQAPTIITHSYTSQHTSPGWRYPTQAEVLPWRD